MQTILVVEHEEALADIINSTLTGEGFEVEVVGDGSSALDWLNEQTPLSILSDVDLPSMNGYQLYQRVRRNPEWVWIPFIFLTGKDDLEAIRYANEIGADGFLSKPFGPEDLMATVWGRLSRFEQLVAHNQPDGQPARGGGRYGLGHLSIDLARRKIRVIGGDVRLSPTEFDIFRRLILAKGAVVTYEELLDCRDAAGDRGAAESLRYHVRNIRQKIQ